MRRAGRRAGTDGAAGRSRSPHPRTVGLSLLVVAVLVLVVGVRAGWDTASPLRPSQVVLEDSFDGGQLDARLWNRCHWWDEDGCTIASNEELEWYRPEQVSVGDGVLTLTAARDEVRGSDGRTYPFRSGMVTTGPPRHDEEAKVAWTYGTLEARVRLPAGRGLWPAIWMLPADEDSRPEIDVLEVLGHDPAEAIMHLHPEDRAAESPSERYRLKGSTFAEDWHDVRLEWTPGLLSWFVDGVRVWQQRGSQVPDEPMYLVLNLAVGGAYPGPPDEATAFPATFAVDHVRVTAMD
jgi:beta-glucanase (GH16 family)